MQVPKKKKISFFHVILYILLISFQKQDPKDVILSEIGESFTFFAPSDDAMLQFMTQRVPAGYFDDQENVMSFFQ